jgi:hypothetical protein
MSLLSSGKGSNWALFDPVKVVKHQQLLSASADFVYQCGSAHVVEVSYDKAYVYLHKIGFY